LYDRSLNREQATQLARTAVRIDPMADAKLVRSIACGFGARHPAEAGRLLDILGEVVPLSRLLPSLMTLLRHRDSYLRSKAVLMVGKANRSARWAEELLTDPDPRIRANAVESLWDSDSEGVIELLRSTASDWNNRVAGNALLGLYRLGDAG